MKAIEMETVIPPDGKLPSSFKEVFGRKARVIVLYQEEARQADSHAENSSERLMALSGKIKAFAKIDDPVAYQKELRDEWQGSE